jgi:hypothetical protein
LLGSCGKRTASTSRGSSGRIAGAAGMTLSYELRPGGNRPGPKDGWDRFDRVVVRLGGAMEGSSASTVAGALEDLSSAMRDLASTLENRPLRASGPDVGGGAADPSGMSGSVSRSV